MGNMFGRAQPQTRKWRLAKTLAWLERIWSEFWVALTSFYPFQVLSLKQVPSNSKIHIKRGDSSEGKLVPRIPILFQTRPSDDDSVTTLTPFLPIGGLVSSWYSCQVPNRVRVCEHGQTWVQIVFNNISSTLAVLECETGRLQRAGLRSFL